MKPVSVSLGLAYVLLNDLADNAARHDEFGGDLTEDVGALREAGWLMACLPRAHGGEGWGCDPSSTHDAFNRLRELGRANLSVARLFEGHMNAVKLVALYGSAATQAIAFGAVGDGAMMGVWGADQPGQPLSFVHEGDDIVLKGAKRFASGLGCVSLVVANADLPGGPQLILIPSDETERIDASGWTVSGMRATASGRYDMTGLRVTRAHLVGRPGDYMREPWFEGGVWRYCAAHFGGAEALYTAMRDALTGMDRATDPHQELRIARAAIAVETARMWVLRAATAVEQPIEPDDTVEAENRLTVSLLARDVTEDVCRSVISTVEQAIGMGAHFEGRPIERMRRDLGLFICQAAPDAKRSRAVKVLVDRGVLPGDL